jgi:hypothetical protein
MSCFAYMLVQVILALSIPLEPAWCDTNPPVVVGDITPAGKKPGIETIFAGVVRGLVVQKVAEAGRTGILHRGIVIQNPVQISDGDPRTSDGLYVSLEGKEDIRSRNGTHAPQIGDDLIIRGELGAFRGRPALRQPELVQIVRSGVDINFEIPAFEVRPPDDAKDANRYWEERHAMRCIVPSQSLVVGSRYTNYPYLMSAITVIRPDHPLVLRARLAARRPFRDVHPLDDDPAVFDNGNGYRILLGDMVIKQLRADAAARLPYVRTFDRLSGPVTGIVLKTDDRYMVHVEGTIEFDRGSMPPADTMQPNVTTGHGRLSVATYNVENLYDAVDDPFDDRDFYDRGPDPLNTNSIGRLHNYVPESAVAYRSRLGGLARQIIEDLGSPHLFMIQEAEDQDITGPKIAVPSDEPVNNKDGQIDSLQSLADLIKARGGAEYRVAVDRAGADRRGVICAYMYRTDALALVKPRGQHGAFKGIPGITYDGEPLLPGEALTNPRAVNARHATVGKVFSRAAQVACFESVADNVLGLPAELRLYAINCHFKSRPDGFVAKRIEQTRLVSSLAKAILEHDAGAFLIVGGDLNTFPRPDEPIPSEPADQLGALYEAELKNLNDVLIKNEPSMAYSYIYRGQAQTLDHLFVSTALSDRLQRVAAIHINSDYPPDPEVPHRHVSDHDPIVAIFDVTRN